MNNEAISRDELDRFLEATRRILKAASVNVSGGLALLATPPDGVYPFASIRDQAIGTVALSELSDFETARALALLLLATQTDEGAWPRLLDTEGRPIGDLLRDDSTPLAMWGLLTYLRLSGDEEIAEQVRDAAERATDYISGHLLNPYLYLVETDVSIHSSASTRGYHVWDCCASAAAFAQAHRVFGGERLRRLALLIRRAISTLMLDDGRFIARLDPSGFPDPRPDIATMAPYYFGLWSPSERSVAYTADMVERALWNVEIGGYTRYLPYSPAERTLPPGPWPAFTAWMAQYHYDFGNKDRGENIVRWLFDNMVDGALPQVVVSRVVVQRYWQEQRAALTEAVEGGDAALPQEIGTALAGDRLLRELDRVERRVGMTGVTAMNAPLVWAHLETLRALKRGGYLDRFALKVPETESKAGEQTQVVQESEHHESWLGHEGHPEER